VLLLLFVHIRMYMYLCRNMMKNVVQSDRLYVDTTNSDAINFDIDMKRFTKRNAKCTTSEKSWNTLYMYLWTYVFMYVYHTVHIYVCIHVYTYIYTHICMYTPLSHTHTRFDSGNTVHCSGECDYDKRWTLYILYLHTVVIYSDIQHVFPGKCDYDLL
jgi:hypothetical protein